MSDDASSDEADVATAPPPEPAPDRPTRSSALALARLHLRTGALALARTELETMAGRDLLDDAGILDLAEVRWRTGDVTGAGEAVAALMDGSDGEDDDRPALAVIIAAEAAAARGRPTESRRLAERLRSTDRASIDDLFAGLPRSSAWPADPLALAPTSATLFPTGAGAAAGTNGGGRSGAAERVDESNATAFAPAIDLVRAPGFWDEPAAVEVDRDDAPEIDPELAAVAEAIAITEATAEHEAAIAAVEVERDGALDDRADADADDGAADDDDTAADDEPYGPDPGDLLADGRDALAAGDVATAAVHFGLLLRLAPALAPAVLDALATTGEPISDAPGLAFVRGDAYRLVGRERDARRAYALARPSSPTPPTPSDADPTPVAADLGDDEPRPDQGDPA